MLNGIRESSRFMTEAKKSRNTALQRVMIFIFKAKDRGLLLAPDGIWDGGRNFLREIRGMSHCDYANDESSIV